MVEPPSKNCPLLTAKNYCITPHVVWATQSARSRLLETAVANVNAFMQGCIGNVVNGMKYLIYSSSRLEPCNENCCSV